MIQQGIQARGMLPVHTHITPEQGGQIYNDDLFQSCGLRVYRNALQAIVNNTTTKVLFDTAWYDIGGDFDADGVDSEFTTPETGYYFICANVTFEVLNDNAKAYVYIFLDDNQEVTAYKNSSNDETTMQVATLINLNVGEVIDIRIRHNHGANRNILNGLSFNNLSIFKIGE